MSKRKQTVSRRARREAELGRFELPSFAAGLATAHLETVEELLAAREARHGTDPYLQRVKEEVRAAMKEAQRWQTMAAIMTNYPYQREEDR